MSQEIPEECMREEIIKLIENPTKYYLKFSKSIRKDIQLKSFDTLSSRLECFNDLCGEENFKEIATTKIEEFVNQGMVDKMIKLWEIFDNLRSQPVSPTITNAMMAQIHTLWNIFEDSTDAAKEQICFFLPYFVRDVIGNEDHEYRLRIEATKLINNLLGHNSVILSELTEKITHQKTFRDDVGTLIRNAADFELQAQLLELVFRLVPPPERTVRASYLFESEDLQNIFLSIEDTRFEPGCRKLLNKINEKTKGVFSILCQMMSFGSEKIPLAKDADTGYHWLDFNIGSKTLKLFVEEYYDETPSQNEDDNVWWHTVVIAHDIVVDCSLFEQQDSVMLKITLKEDITKLIPSRSSDDVRDVQIKFGSDCDINGLREVLESFSWIRPQFYSPPKSSVAIFTVHLADRQQGEMQVMETMDSPTPEALIKKDGIEDEVLVNDSSITATLDAKEIEESEELFPSQDKPREQPKNIKTASAESQDHVVEKTEDLERHPTYSQEVKAGHDSPDVNDNGGQLSIISANVKAAKDNHLEQNQSVIDEVDKGGNISPLCQAKDLIKAKDVTEDKHDEENIENQKQTQRTLDKSKETGIPPETKSRASNESESGTESGTSRRFSKRTPERNARNKRNKSPLPVEIIKSERRKSSSSSGKSSTDSENERKSPERKKQKTYPSAFNVAKRMETRKNSMLACSSQDIKKKVFGRRGSSFGQKESPARRANHFERMKSENTPPSKKQHSRNNGTRTKEPAGEQSEHTTEEDDEKEVIQDSMPLDDSTELVPSRRRSGVPKESLTKGSDKSLPQSESFERTSHRIQFVNDKAIPTRLGTILRKGDRKERDSLLEESTRSGLGSATSSSTSDTDWPGPDSEPGPKLKHSLVLCKSVRESKPTRKTACQRGKNKRASVSPGLSAISEEKSPIDIPHDEETRQAKSSDSRSKKRGGQIDGFGDMEKEQESGNTSEDTLVYETTSNRKTRSSAKASEGSRTSRRKKEENYKVIPRNKPKEKQNKIDFEQEFDFDLPNLTILAAEESLAGSEIVERESATLPNRSVSWKDKKARDKSAADRKGLLLDEDNVGIEEDEGAYTQDYTTTESRDKRKDRAHGRIGDRESRLEEDNNDELYRENSNVKKRPKHYDNVNSKESRNKKEYPKQQRPTLVKRWFSGDELDEDSDFLKEHKSPKRRKTYGKKQKQRYSSTLREEDNWTRDKDAENKKRTTDVPRLSWQSSSKAKSPAQKSLSRTTNKSDEEFHSGYENDDHDLDAPEYDQGYTEPPQRKETRNPRSRAPKLGQERSEEQSKVLQVREMEENEDEVIQLRRFCQDITATQSSTPASDFPIRKRRDKETDDGKSAKKFKDHKIQGNSEGQMSDSGKTPSKHQGEKVENFGDRSVSRSRTTTNERLGHHGNTSKYKTPNNNPSRLDDSGLGQSIGTGSRRRTLVTSSKGSTTPKGRRKGELRVTTSISKTPVTPRTSAIMRRIDEEEDFGHTKKPRQIFSDWTSSGPSRTVSTPYQEPYSPESNNDDHQDREQKRAHERLKAKGDHNPNIRPRQLFRQVNDHSPEEELDDDILHDKSSSSEDMRDISNILSCLGKDLSERLRRKRQNLQRFCKRTMDVTIETINRHFEQNLSNRDEVIDSFNDKFLEEIKTLKDEMDKAKKNEEQILARIEEDMKLLKTRRILQENKIKGLRNLCVEFQSEMIKGNDSQSDHQDTFQDEIRQQLAQVQEHFLLEAQRQDRENLRRSLRSVLDATTM